MFVPNYLDLFAGAGGLSEGFIQAGYTPVAHVEVDEAACFTLKTRAVYHWLKKHNNLKNYYRYIAGEMSREDLYRSVPKNVLNTVLNIEISKDTLLDLFTAIDGFLKDNTLDLIVGGPPCQAYSPA